MGLSCPSELSCNSEKEEFEEEGEEDFEVISNKMTPYGDQPLAELSEGDVPEDEETDADGLTPVILAARYGRKTAVNAWFVLF